MKIMSAAALVLGLATPALAHEAPIHAHAELVPIPAYNLPFGAASAAASLQAAEAFLANFDEATKAQFMFDLNSMEREGWSNLPARFVTRAGISVGDLSANTVTASTATTTLRIHPRMPNRKRLKGSAGGIVKLTDCRLFSHLAMRLSH